MNWETVIGLEVHAELSTKSKIFCGCTTSFGDKPNTHVCPVCSGMPGVLPKLNIAVVEYAVKTGLALNCDINKNCKFDRKNYFYPDLPKAYQVSQLYAPICINGKLEINVANENENGSYTKEIGIREIHMEEDAGKLIHDPLNGDTYMDFNRCGVPLLEIVTNPDFSSADEVAAYLEKLREILLYLGVCDCKMQEGSLRADVNLSVRRRGEELGVRTEMKNLNSFKAAARAIEHETARQIAILESGGEVVQETRRWNDDKRSSYGMRSKENAQDYRYFPEPDLLPIEISEDWLSKIKENIPELGYQKRERYIKSGITEFEASIITTDKNISDLFESIWDKSGQPIEAAHMIVGVIMRLLNETDQLPENLNINADKLAYLIGLLESGKINRNSYKDIIEAIYINDVDVDTYIKDKNLLMVSDSSAVDGVVADVLAKNPAAVADYKSGIEKSFGFLMGQVMREMRGAGNPDMVKNALIDQLSL